MPDRASDRRSNRGFNAALVVLGAGLGIGAVCLIVFGTTSSRQLLVGIILGLWAALLAAFGLQGLRRPPAELGVAPEDLEALQTELTALAETSVKATQDGLKATQDSITSQGQDFRRMSELQSARDTAARREADLSLQLAIRHEIERTVADQVGTLREEVSSLRAEVVDRLDGQIKLERIEITRVIGSDLEALQNEVRRLAAQREAAYSGDRGATQGFLAQPAPAPSAAGFAPEPFPAAASDLDEVIEAELIDTKPAADLAGASAEPASFDQSWGPVRAVRAKAPAAASPFEPDPLGPDPLPKPLPLPPQPQPQPTPQPLPPQPVEPSPFDPPPEPRPFDPPPGPAPDPEPLPPLEPPPSSDYLVRHPGADIFAELPRLTPIPADLLGSSGRRRAPEDDPSSPRYVGRRRPDGLGPDEDTGQLRGLPAEPEPASEPEPEPPSGRGHGRRRAPGHASD